MHTSSIRRGRAAAGALAATAALAGGTTATAVAAPSYNLPAAGKLTTCHTTLFKVGGRLPVHTAFASQKGKHPGKTLLTCGNANAVAKGQALLPDLSVRPG